jgi:hypothetical protein
MPIETISVCVGASNTLRYLQGGHRTFASTEEEAINRDWVQHVKTARAIAEEPYDAWRVAWTFFETIGLASQ